MANGTTRDSAMSCPFTTTLERSVSINISISFRRVNQTKRNWLKKAACEKQSLTRSRRIKNQEPRGVMGNDVCEVSNLVSNVTYLLEEECKAKQPRRATE